LRQEARLHRERGRQRRSLLRPPEDRPQGRHIHPVAGGKVFSIAAAASISEKIEALRETPKIERKPYDPKDLHEKWAFPLGQAIDGQEGDTENEGAEIAYGFGGDIIDIAVTAVGQTVVSVINGSKQAEVLAKNLASRIKTAVDNEAIKRASRAAKNLFKTEGVTDGEFIKIVNALNS